MSTDVAAAKTFYESVLGVTTRDIDVGRVYTLLRVGEKDVAGAMSIGPEHGR
jgi:predicted enzyme related to lactoylglutathione lyase